MISFVCCCFPTVTSLSTTPTKHKRHTPHKQKTAFIISCPSSTPCHLSPIIIPCTPTTTNSSQHPFCEDSTMTSIDDSSTLITDTTSSSQQMLNNSPRISAIRELVETEQRYVNDLRTVSNEFIKPLSNARVLSDYDIDQLFSNWFNLIACNTVLLSTLQEQVQYKENVNASDDDDESVPVPRSASMSNIAIMAQAPTKKSIEGRRESFFYQVSHSPSPPPLPPAPATHRSKYRTARRMLRRSPSPNTSTLRRPVSIDRLTENTVPQSSHLSTSMTIDDSTLIGEILCSYLPYMADAYFQYCNCRAQANKNLQAKMETDKQFRTSSKIFQNQTGGLSLNGYLTKPIQRVTRYPLLIEKILRHTPEDHPDHQSIQQAHDCARQLNERINKQICEQENRSRLDWLQQHIIFGTDEYSADGYIFDELLKFNSLNKFHRRRELLLHGLLIKIPSGKELLAFLFNDFLLLSTIKSSSSHWQSQIFELKSNFQLKLYRSPIFLTDISSINEVVNEKLMFSITTKINKKPLVLKADLSNIRTLWIRTISNAIEECQTLEKSIAAEKTLFFITDNERNQETAVARLTLVAYEAFIPVVSHTSISRHRTMNPYCEITVNSLSLKTPYMKRTTNPKWNESMEFLLYDLTQDIIHINLFDHEYFSPDENIGFTSIHLTDILPCSLEILRSQLSHTFTYNIYFNSGASMLMKCTVELLEPCQ